MVLESSMKCTHKMSNCRFHKVIIRKFFSTEMSAYKNSKNHIKETGNYQLLLGKYKHIIN